MDEQPRPRIAAPIAWMDGRVVPAAEATVPLLDEGFQRGDAVFETVLVLRGRTHALDRHLDRMRRSARALGMRVPVLRQVVADLLAAWGERDGVLKLIVTRSGTVRGLAFQPQWPPSLALAQVEVPWRSALSGVKTLSYAVNQWVTREAQAAHADDALIVDGGIAHELPTAAIVWVRDGALRSPDPAELPILDSVTLRALQEIAQIELGVYPVGDVLAADEVFVLSATRPILPVHAIDEQEFPAPGPVTAMLRDAFLEQLEKTLDPLP